MLLMLAVIAETRYPTRNTRTDVSAVRQTIIVSGPELVMTLPPRHTDKSSFSRACTLPHLRFQGLRAGPPPVYTCSTRSVEEAWACRQREHRNPRPCKRNGVAEERSSSYRKFDERT